MLNVNRLRMLREVAGRGTIAAAAEALFMAGLRSTRRVH
jgi:DNA-binding transcriptional LysR family regulator